MHTGKSYSLSDFLVWTRRKIYILILLGVLPVILYQMVDLKWLAIPWTVVALLGTATVFIVGFKNIQTYNRAWEARQIWGDIASSSRAWGTMSRDFLNNPEKSRELIYRHLAWLTAMRYQMRDSRAWETTTKTHNAEYRRTYSYSVPEKETALETELAKYISSDEVKHILTTRNKATQLVGLQSRTLKDLFANQEIVAPQFVDMRKALYDFCVQQGRSERIKDFPYPRQYATVSAFLVWSFCFLLPFGLLREFDKLNDGMDGLMKGNMIWLVIPFSVLISWMYASLEQVGESTECPFEGNANDVPISQMCRSIEIDLREILGETDLPPLLQPKHNIIL